MTDAYTYIRFSTPEQMRGDSWLRQKEAIDQFIEEQGLTLKESSAFSDLGVSGFRGIHLTKGLGKFIAQVDEKIIKEGSYLIVESLDRLSRQRVVDALNLVLSLVSKGIKVVTLNDAGIQILDKEAGFEKLILAMSTMQRANSESEMKSHRVKAAWTRKKKNAASMPVSARCPEWLAYNKEEKKFEPVPDRVTTIKKIFELANEGIGRHRIVRILNSEKFESFRTPSQGWQSSSVHKILANRAVIGIYQPHQTSYDDITGKKVRTIDGPEVPNYYPAVIEEDLFRQVNSRVHQLAMPLRGRQGPALTNLFTGIVFCRWCGAPAMLSNKGDWKYLVCSKARRNMGCEPYRSWPYDDAEMFILASLKEVDFEAALSGVDVESQLKDAKNSMAVLAEQLAAKRKTLSNLSESFAHYDGALPKTLIKQYADIEREIEVKESELVEIRNQVASLDRPLEDHKTFSERLLKLYGEMVDAKDSDKYMIRVRLRERISVLVERIELRPIAKSEPAEIEGLENKRKIFIKFRNGTVRMVLQIGKNGIYKIDRKQK